MTQGSVASDVDTQTTTNSLSIHEDSDVVSDGKSKNSQAILEDALALSSKKPKQSRDEMDAVKFDCGECDR